MGFSFSNLFGGRMPDIDPSVSPAEVRAIRRLVAKQPGFGGRIMSIKPAGTDDIPDDCPNATPANAFVIVAGRLDAPLAGAGMRLLAIRTDTGFTLKPIGVWFS